MLPISSAIGRELGVNWTDLCTSNLIPKNWVKPKPTVSPPALHCDEQSDPPFPMGAGSDCSPPRCTQMGSQSALIRAGLVQFDLMLASRLNH